MCIKVLTRTIINRLTTRATTNKMEKARSRENLMISFQPLWDSIMEPIRELHIFVFSKDGPTASYRRRCNMILPAAIIRNNLNWPRVSNAASTKSTAAACHFNKTTHCSIPATRNMEILKSYNYLVKIENIVWFKNFPFPLSWQLQVLLKLKDFFAIYYFSWHCWELGVWMCRWLRHSRAGFHPSWTSILRPCVNQHLHRYHGKNPKIHLKYF